MDRLAEIPVREQGETLRVANQSNQSVFYVCSHRGDKNIYIYNISDNISIIQNISYIVVSI